MMNGRPPSVMVEEIEGRTRESNAETQPLLRNDESRQNVPYGNDEVNTQLDSPAQSDDDSDESFTKFKLLAAMLNFVVSGIVLTGIGV